MNKLKALKKFYEKYERLLIPGALVFGFITDVATFRFLNFPLAMSLLAFQLFFVGINITVINFYESKKIAGKFFSYWRILAPLFLQYSFGNLLSAFLIFYSHSGSFFASWPFLVTIIFLMIGNEVFRKYNIRPTIQISIYFFAFLSYLNILFPSLLKDISPQLFVGITLLSFVYILLFTSLLTHFTITVREKKKKILASITAIFIAMNLFYFLNLIPPIPLSITEIGVHHYIEREGDGYRAITEDCGSFFSCLFLRERRHISTDRQAIYVYSAIYAPSEMTIKAEHQWQKYDHDKRRWETRLELPFEVIGGRETGFRWYTYNTIEPGYWRVNVKTARGQTIGRINFYLRQGQEERIEKRLE